MSRLHRRVAVLSLTAAIVAVAVVLAAQQTTPPTRTFRVVLGVGDTKPTDWSGTVSTDGGDVMQIAGWRFEAGDKVDGTAGWTCKTREYVAFGKRRPIQLADGSPRVPPVNQPWPNGVTIRLKGNAPKVTLKLAQGEVKFDASTIAAGEPLSALAGRVIVERLPTTLIVRQAAKPKAANPVQDDYPCFWVHYKSGKQYLAWVAYNQAKDRVLVVERDGPDGAWSAPKEIDPPGYHFRVALATTHTGTL